jgi:hypothetical protein
MSERDPFVQYIVTLRAAGWGHDRIVYLIDALSNWPRPHTRASLVGYLSAEGFTHPEMARMPMHLLGRLDRIDTDVIQRLLDANDYVYEEETEGNLEDLKVKYLF